MSAMPMVYFIDDSATMREVIKIAFRRETAFVLLAIFFAYIWAFILGSRTSVYEPWRIVAAGHRVRARHGGRAETLVQSIDLRD